MTSTNTTVSCEVASCPWPYEYSKTSIVHCFCSIPLIVEYRLKSPGFSDFVPFRTDFEKYLSSGLDLYQYQLEVVSFEWEKGPRLRMSLKLFPVYFENSTYTFNNSEVRRITNKFTGWNIRDSELYGPYELIKFTLLGPYANGLSRKLILTFLTS